MSPPLCPVRCRRRRRGLPTHSLLRRVCRGKGLGQALVSELLKRSAGRPVFLITVGKRRAFYEECGFEEAPGSAAPLALQAERLVGTPIAWAAAGDRLIVMKKQG